MTKRRLQDCWQAVLRVSIPIDATAASLTAAQAAVAALALPAGAAVEIVTQRFARMAVQTVNGQAFSGSDEAATSSGQRDEQLPLATAAQQSGEGTAAPKIPTGLKVSDVEKSVAAYAYREPSDLPAGLDIPAAFDRRVPRI